MKSLKKSRNDNNHSMRKATEIFSRISTQSHAVVYERHTVEF